MGNSVCIEMGKNLLKIVEGSFDKKLNIDKVIDIDLKELNSLDIESFDEKTVGNYIFEKLKENGLKNRNVNFILSCMPNLLIRDIVVPIADMDETYNMIKYESRQFFPVNIDNYVIDFKLIERLEEEGKQRVLVVALPKTVVEKIVNVCKLSGIKLKKIDIEANVISKIICSYMTNKGIDVKKPYAVINIERSFVTSVIAKEGVIKIAKTFPVDFEKLLLKDEALNEDMLYSINDIADNVSKFISFYKSKEHAVINEVYMIGELANYEPIKSRIQAETSMNIAEFNSESFVKFKNDVDKDKFLSISAAAGGLI